MVFCTDCGGPVEPNHDYCYSCGSRIAHPEPVVETVPVVATTPVDDAEPAEDAPEDAKSVIIESSEIVEIPKNRTRRRFDWKWIAAEVAWVTVVYIQFGLLTSFIATLNRLWILLSGAGFLFILFMALNTGVVKAKRHAVAQQREAEEKDSPYVPPFTPIWMRIVGIGFIAIGLLLTVDLFRFVGHHVSVITNGRPGEMTYLLVDSSVPIPTVHAVFLAIIGVGFLARWGFHVAGGMNISMLRDVEVPVYVCPACGRHTSAEVNKVQCFYCEAGLSTEDLTSSESGLHW